MNTATCKTPAEMSRTFNGLEQIGQFADENSHYSRLLREARINGTVRHMQPSKIAKEIPSDSVVAKAMKSLKKSKAEAKMDAFAKSLNDSEALALDLGILEDQADAILDNPSNSEVLAFLDSL